ncbi:MAG TPA: 4-hydroxy-tetrahydrodipicolinate reductase [Bacillota bacterium]|nr:4-hydroxy-tetrahydrodipicolinate reductase [Bacillota bacterium]
MIKTCLFGLGRTGSVVAEQLLNSPEFQLATVFARPNSPKIDHPLSDYVRYPSDLTIQSSDSLPEQLKKQQVKVAIDFTAPEASLKNARILAENGINIVIGTTGFNKMQIFELKSLIQKYKIGLVYAPNISLGINLLLSVVKTIARLIPHYDVEITESHHRNKKDSPSGTAIKIADAINTVKGINSGKYTYGRKGQEIREAKEIGIHAVRAGGIVGVHSVLFAGESDEIEITHRSYSRLVFAEGALQAAKFIANRRGYYCMEDLLMETEEPETPALPHNLQLIAD